MASLKVLLSQTIAVQLPVMVAALDAQGNVIAWNRQCEEVTGFPVETVRANPQSLSKIFPSPAFGRLLLEKWQVRNYDHLAWTEKIICQDGAVKTIHWEIPPKQYEVSGWPVWFMGLELVDPSTD